MRSGKKGRQPKLPADNQDLFHHHSTLRRVRIILEATFVIASLAAEIPPSV